MILDLAAVVSGGALGALLRFGLIHRAELRANPKHTPWDAPARATLLANTVGCAVFGGWVAVVRSGGLAADLDPAVAGALDLFVLTGVCGGWTTFSTVVGDGFRMKEERGRGSALGYAATTLTLGTVALWAGSRLGG